MEIKSIELGKDKNGNQMKIITIGGKKVYVNSKYNKEVFDAIKEDSDVELEQDGKFWKIKPESLGISEKPKFNKSAGIKEGMAIKKENIREAQEHKVEGIKLAGACRDATLIITAYKEKYEGISDQELKDEWVSWRNWFYKQWEENLPSPF